MKTLLFTTLLILSLSLHSFAQHHGGEHHHTAGRHTIAFTFGVTYVPNAIDLGFDVEGINRDIFAKTIGVDYFYSLPKGFSVGLISDIELEKYIIDVDEDELIRQNIWIIAALLTYEIKESGVALGVGPGIEIEESKNFIILKCGIEWKFIRGENWGIAPFFSYDFKEKYHSWEIGIGFSRTFGKAGD